MFELKFTRADLIRSAWAFVFAFVAAAWAIAEGPVSEAAKTCQQATGCDFSGVTSALLWSAAIAGVTAGGVAVKNFLLSDRSAVKG